MDDVLVGGIGDDTCSSVDRCVLQNESPRSHVALMESYDEENIDNFKITLLMNRRRTIAASCVCFRESTCSGSSIKLFTEAWCCWYPNTGIS